MFRPLPFDLSNQVYDLMQQKADEPDADADQAHHQPTVPVQSTNKVEVNGCLLVKRIPTDVR